jgi:signal transduction histidine kinase
LTQLKSKFLANATHELRTPLNSIINYIGFVRDEPETLNQVQVTYLDQALQGSEKLLDLINNILDMSKIEAGQMALLRHPVDLREVATEIIPVVNTMIGQKPIKMVADIAPTMPIITGDRLRLRQIMLNVLSNAVRFTQAGQIYMNVYPENGSIIIKVTDTGEGIEEAILPVIFDQFVTKDLIDTGRASGSGLGLAITKSLVELHHGRIEVESRVQSGTTFIVNLPVKNGDN